MIATDVFTTDVTKTRNGEWGMGNGEWGMGNEK